ncbi:hypothetical protein QN379_18200 [Glaciimonas sp. Gout2]|uniref:hypothetical protein n=1 Tax=unclassified Glaciimonas TaxID=2644401 RepID=UPI002B236297|nr:MULTISPECIES: hypothetical protein [unclassified Glaciimonas]MEB0012593.1 hypothetical protein [Glaciimonas sp. Cout2]MEB0083944.1 hypothetical protein [Glaciimonas sp. Gout2]
MKTTLIATQQIGKFDAEILNKLKPHSLEISAVRKERMIIGIRNEQGEIYRVIGVTGLTLFMDAIYQLVELNMIDELEALDHPQDGYDAIFSAR